MSHYSPSTPLDIEDFHIGVNIKDNPSDFEKQIKSAAVQDIETLGNRAKLLV